MKTSVSPLSFFSVFCLCSREILRVMKNIGVRSFIVGLCLMGLGSWSPSLKAQIADRVYKTDYHIDPEKARELSVASSRITSIRVNLPKGIRCRGFGYKAKRFIIPCGISSWRRVSIC